MLLQLLPSKCDIVVVVVVCVCVCVTHAINQKKGNKVNQATCGDTLERPKWVLRALKNVRIGGQQRE